MKKHPITSSHKLDAAKGWLSLGIEVLPLPSGQKRSRFKWAQWLDGLDEDKLKTHWAKYPDDDLAILPSNELVILDADTDLALKALNDLEAKHELKPSLRVKTRKGEHHYFRVPADIEVRANSHSTAQHPDRIDVRTGQNQVVVAPSTDKQILESSVTSIKAMVSISNAFMDDLMRHNGQSIHTEPDREGATGFAPSDDEELIHAYLSAMLECLDPEEGGHDLWIRTIMAVHSATHGSDDGLEIVDTWSSAGHTYPGRRVMESTWRNLRPDGGVSLGTLIWRLREAGLDWVEICDAVGPQFQVEDYQVVRMGQPAPLVDGAHPLERYSVTHQIEELKAMAQNAKPALEPIALQGQATVVYAPPNTGKTLLTLHMLIQSIRKGHLQAKQVYYLNCDDSTDGLLLKAQIARQHDFRMLSPGYAGFELQEFKNLMVQMAAKGTAKGTVLILDTLKKFVNVMDKVEGSAFGSLCRGFCLKGGTIIALGHPNKHKSTDGTSIPGGTTDVIDDFDCAWVLDLQKSGNPHKRVVTFRNRKRRGGVVDSATFSYAPHLPYLEMLSSVRREDEFNDEDLVDKTDSPTNPAQHLIDSIASVIREGINPQKAIVESVALKTRSGTGKIKKVLEQYEDVYWKFGKKDRGAKHYSLIESPLQSSSVDDLDF